MDNILALVDGSGYSQSVCDHAGWAAAATGAQLLFCHVMKSRHNASASADLSGSIGLGARTALLEELAEMDQQKAQLLKKRGRAILEDAHQRANAMGALEVSEMLRYGRFYESVAELENHADLLVIGKRGETSHINMDHVGSNLERVVRATKKPVLVASRQFAPIRRVLVAFDGGQSALNAIDYMAASPLFRNLSMQLIQVGNTGTTQAIEKACSKLEAVGLTVEFRIIDGQADQVIATSVRDGNIDLLVMGAYGHTRIRSLIIGSTTTQMVHNCKVPIFLFR